MTFSLITAFNRRRRPGAAQLSFFKWLRYSRRSAENGLHVLRTPQEKKKKVLEILSSSAVCSSLTPPSHFALQLLVQLQANSFFYVSLLKSTTLSCDVWQPSSFLHSHNSTLQHLCIKNTCANQTESAGLMGTRTNVQSFLFATNSNASVYVANRDGHAHLQRSSGLWLLLVARFGIVRVAEEFIASLILFQCLSYMSILLKKTKILAN